MNVKQLAIGLMRDRTFGAESPIVRMLDGVFAGMEREVSDQGCLACLRDRLVTRLNDAIEEGRLLNYDLADLRIVNGDVIGTVLITPMPTTPYIDLTFTVTDRGAEL